MKRIGIACIALVFLALLGCSNAEQVVPVAQAAPLPALGGRLLTQAILDQQVDRKSFDPADPALTQLSKAGIKKLITLFNGYFQGNQRYQGQVLSRRDHIYRQATAFAQQLLHPLPPLSDDHDPLDLL